MKNGKPKVAIVHDWLVAYAGADRVVDCMHHVFPDAPIYTLVYDENNMPAWFKDYDIRTTYLQKLPFATKLYRAMLPWMPRAFEALDLSEYDMVISSCSSCSKGVITRPDAVHICYCHTPTRYVWDFYYTYRNNANALVRAVMPGSVLNDAERKLLKAADRLSALIKCMEEVESGNREFTAALAQQKADLAAMHSPEADYFIEHMLPCYTQNLDELTKK